MMRAQGRRSKLFGAIVVLTLIGAACSKGSTPSTAPTQSPAASAPGASSSPSSAGFTVRQGAGGFVFSPATFSVKKGESITVSNVGTVSHTFTITGKGIDVVNSSGQSQTVTINLAPGTYQFICRFHVSLGMKGTLTVTG